MRFLVTGAAGFIGHHTVEHLLANTDDEIVGIVSFRHRGCSMRLRHLGSPRFRVVHHDLVGPISERLAEDIGPVDIILNIASESHVDRSITDPVPFVRNNVDLVLNMLEYARLVKPRVFIQVSTDEVYGPALRGDRHEEWAAIKPSNPYSASKAAQEAIAISYWRTYGVPLIITNTMNNFGERQDVEKFIPKVIAKILRGEKVEIHGRNDVPGSRFYLHARNHADALLFLARAFQYGPPAFPLYEVPGRYNVVGEREVNNLEMATRIASLLGKSLDYEIVDFHGSRPGHDLRYALDGDKIVVYGWRAPVPFGESLERTVRWTQEHPEWLA